MTSKLAVKIKKKKLVDEYELTTKQIICRFKYLVLCFDKADTEHHSHGLVCLTKEQLTELLTEQCISFQLKHEVDLLYDVWQTLKEWHPQIAKVTIDNEHIHTVDNLLDYPFTMEHLSMSALTARDFDLFRGLSHNVVDVCVYFKLLKRINHIKDHHTNFHYLRRLLADQMLNWNTIKQEALYLDEVTVNKTQIPFSNQSDLETERVYVYPQFGLFPLYPVREAP